MYEILSGVPAKLQQIRQRRKISCAPSLKLIILRPDKISATKIVHEETGSKKKNLGGKVPTEKACCSRARQKKSGNKLDC